MRLGFSVVSAVLLAGSLQAQNSPPADPQPAPDLVLHIDVNLVQVDAVVHDRKDRPVTGLQAEDFEVLEDGRSQKITHFSYVDLTPAGGPSITHGGFREKHKTAAPAPPETLTPGTVKRTVVIVVDDLNLSFQSTAYLRFALKNFVAAKVGPNDLVSIARTSAGMGMLQNFTNDKMQLFAAVDSVKWNTMGGGGITPDFGPITAASSFAALGGAGEDDNQSYLYVQATMNALISIVQDMRGMPGRKEVIFFSDGVPAPRAGDFDLVLKLLRRVADAANRASVVVNCVDARGLQSTAPSAADHVGGDAAGNRIAYAAAARTLNLENAQNGLIYLAAQTGGRVVLNGNDLSWAIDRVIDDLDGYYLIGYKPPAGTFGKDGKRTDFHRLQVRVKRKGLSVRSRSGFFGLTDAESVPRPASDGEKMLAAMRSPFGAKQIPLKLTVQFLSDGPGQNSLSVMLHIDAKTVSFKPPKDGIHHAELELLLTGYDQTGRAVEGADKVIEIDLPEPQYQAAIANGFVYTERVPVQRSGFALVRVAVRDVANGQLGAASQFVVLPDLANKRLVVGAVVLGRTDNATALNNAAVRVFKAGQPIPYRFSIFNPRVGTNQMSELQTQVKLFHEGKEVWSSAPMTTQGQPGERARKLIASSALHLGDSFEPGEYYLQVLATDLLGKGKTPATQWISFELSR